ncbi:MAG: hypothetical protein AABX73_04705 [Nanoarchaeota archaeon]
MTKRSIALFVISFCILVSLPQFVSAQTCLPDYNGQGPNPSDNRFLSWLVESFSYNDQTSCLLKNHKREEWIINKFIMPNPPPWTQPDFEANKIFYTKQDTDYDWDDKKESTRIMKDTQITESYAATNPNIPMGYSYNLYERDTIFAESRNVLETHTYQAGILALVTQTKDIFFDVYLDPNRRFPARQQNPEAIKVRDLTTVSYDPNVLGTGPGPVLLQHTPGAIGQKISADSTITVYHPPEYTIFGIIPRGPQRELLSQYIYSPPDILQNQKHYERRYQLDSNNINHQIKNTAHEETFYPDGRRKTELRTTSSFRIDGTRIKTITESRATADNDITQSINKKSESFDQFDQLNKEEGITHAVNPNTFDLAYYNHYVNDWQWSVAQGKLLPGQKFSLTRLWDTGAGKYIMQECRDQSYNAIGFEVTHNLRRVNFDSSTGKKINVHSYYHQNLADETPNVWRELDTSYCLNGAINEYYFSLTNFNTDGTPNNSASCVTHKTFDCDGTLLYIVDTCPANTNTLFPSACTATPPNFNNEESPGPAPQTALDALNVLITDPDKIDDNNISLINQPPAGPEKIIETISTDEKLQLILELSDPEGSGLDYEIIKACQRTLARRDCVNNDNNAYGIEISDLGLVTFNPKALGSGDDIIGTYIFTIKATERVSAPLGANGTSPQKESTTSTLIIKVTPKSPPQIILDSPFDISKNPELSINDAISGRVISIKGSSSLDIHFSGLGKTRQDITHSISFANPEQRDNSFSIPFSTLGLTGQDYKITLSAKDAEGTSSPQLKYTVYLSDN